MIEAAKQKAAAPPPEEDAPAQLPTPPSEGQVEVLPAQGLSAELLSNMLPPDSGLSEGSWPTPQSNARSSPSSSPPPLDDADPPSFEEALDDRILQSPFDPLEISNQRFEFPDPSSRNSPTSSNEAEPDVDIEDLWERHAGERGGARGLLNEGPMLDVVRALQDRTESAVPESSSTMSDVDV